jgi:hypothetical protein
MFGAEVSGGVQQHQPCLHSQNIAAATILSQSLLKPQLAAES